jgi:hypothetical protein
MSRATPSRPPSRRPTPRATPSSSAPTHDHEGERHPTRAAPLATGAASAPWRRALGASRQRARHAPASRPRQARHRPPPGRTTPRARDRDTPRRQPARPWRQPRPEHPGSSRRSQTHRPPRGHDQDAKDRTPRPSSRPPRATSKPPARGGILDAMLRRPLLEHRPREAQMTPDANARQTPSPRRVTHPRRTHVQQRSSLLNIEQRLIQRQRENGINGHDRLPIHRYVAAQRRDPTKTASPCLLQITFTRVR